MFKAKTKLCPHAPFLPHLKPSLYILDGFLVFRYFPEDATAEMLDEWRPLMCPFDVTMQKAITYFELFLPTTLPPELHHKGFK